MTTRPCAYSMRINIGTEADMHQIYDLARSKPGVRVTPGPHRVTKNSSSYSLYVRGDDQLVLLDLAIFAERRGMTVAFHGTRWIIDGIAVGREDAHEETRPALTIKAAS